MPEDADRSSRAISSVQHHPLKELETAAPQLIEPELTNHLLVAAKIAAHAVDQQAHDPFLTAQKGRLDEEMLQQKLIRQQLLYEERMREQEKLLQLQILERERLEQRLIEQHQQHRPVESAESGPDTRASSTAGQPTVITMTKLSPPQFRNFLRREEENEVEEETVPESPEYSEQTAPAAGVLSFVRMEGVQAQQGPRSSGDVRQRQVGKEKLVRNRVGNEKFMENVGQSEIILKTQTGKHGRVVKELPKANGPAQRNALVSSQPEHWVLSALKDYKQEPTNIVAPQDEEAKLYDLKTGRLVQPLAHLGTAGVASQNPDTPVFSVHHKVAPSATERQHSEVDQGPKMYSRYLTAVPPSQPQPSNRSTGSAGRRVVTIDAPSRGSSAINMSDFYEQIAMTASQQLPMDERRKLSNRGSPQAAPETSAERRRRRQEEEEEYNRYYADIFEEFKQSLPSL